MRVGPVDRLHGQRVGACRGHAGLVAPVRRFARQGPRRTGERGAAQLRASSASSELLRAGRPGARSLPAADRVRRGARSVRSARHDLRDQRTPSPTRHISQLVRVPGCRPHRPAHHRRSGRYRVRPHRAWRDDQRAAARPHRGHPGSAAVGLLQLRGHSARRTGFTFYASIDHLHADGQFVGVGLMEFQTMYAALIKGDPPVGMPQAGSYDDFCVRQRDVHLGVDPGLAGGTGVDRLRRTNDGTFPAFPLPLGDQSVPCDGDLLSVTLMDEQQTQRFESACTAAGARFIGGMFACIAIAVHELTGAETYFGLTPKDTRSTEADFATQGWFTGLIPITVPVAGSSFNDDGPVRADVLRFGRAPGASAVRTRRGIGAVAAQAPTALLPGELL